MHVDVCTEDRRVVHMREEVSCMRIGLCARSWTVSILLLLVLFLAACAGGGEAAQSGGRAASKDPADVGQKPESGAEFAVAGSALPESQVAQDDFDRMIVKTAEFGIRAEDVRRDAARAQEVAARFGGSIISSQTYRVDNSVYAELVISVPSG